MVTGSVERLRDRLRVKRRIGDGMLIERLTIGIVGTARGFQTAIAGSNPQETSAASPARTLPDGLNGLSSVNMDYLNPRQISRQPRPTPALTGCAREPAPRRCGVSTVALPVEVVARKRPTDEQQIAVVRAA